MTRFMFAMALGLAAFTAQAADTAAAKPPTAQQQKMKSCNADAGDKKGAERKAFMKECLSAKPAAAAASGTAQQQKMKSCNAEAKGKTGAERKTFMKECLSGAAN